MGNQNFKISKIERPVEILLDLEPVQPETFTLFLNQYSRFGTREESLAEFLNSNTGFIPVRSGKSGTPALINLQEAIYIRETESAQPMTARKKISLLLRNRTEMAVEHFQEMPDSRSRLLDFLNGDEQFICFLQEGTRIYINRDKIIRSSEHE
jgi:hypothetical protein